MAQDPILYLCLVKGDGEPHPEKALCLRTFGLFSFTEDPPIHPVPVHSANSLIRFKTTSVRDVRRKPCASNSSLAKFITKNFDRCAAAYVVRPCSRCFHTALAAYDKHRPAALQPAAGVLMVQLAVLPALP